MKLSINKLYISLILLCLTGFLGMYKFLPLSGALYSVDMMYIYLLAFTFIWLFVSKTRYIHKWGANPITKEILKLTYFIIFFMLIEVIISNYRYKQGLANVIKESMYYLIFAIVVIAICNMELEETVSLEWFCKKIVLLSMFCSTFAIILFSLYTYFGLNPLQLSVENIRNGTIRFGIGSNLVVIALIISLSNMMNEGLNKTDLSNMILGIVQLYFINKTRSVILYLIIVFCYMILNTRKTNKIVKIVVYFTVFASIFLLIFGNSSFGYRIEGYINADYGLMARVEAIQFYFSQFLKHPLFGMGFISTKKTLSGWNLLYGDSGIYYRGDVGVIGLLNAYGIVGFIWSCLFLKRIYNSAVDNTTYSLSLKFIVIYFVISWANLSFMDAERLLYMIIPVMMSILISNNINIRSRS